MSTASASPASPPSARPLEYVYAALTLPGAALTWYYNLQYMEEAGGFTVQGFVAGGFANPAAASLSVDLFVVGVAVSIFIIVEARRLGMRFAWLYLLLAVNVAMAFACPLFLWMRERRLRLRPARS